MPTQTHTDTQVKETHILLREKILYRGYSVLALVAALLVGQSIFLWQYLKRAYGITFEAVSFESIDILMSIIVVVVLFLFVHSLKNTIVTAERIIDVLKLSRERYSLAISGSSEGLWDWDVSTGKVYFSPYWKKMLGYGEEDAIETIDFWKNQIHPEDLAVFENAIEVHFAKHSSFYNAEYRLRTKLGSYIWVYDKGRAVRDDNGEVTRLVGSTRDVSNIKNVEEVLKSRTQELEKAQGKLSGEIQNSKKFQQAVESATDAIAIMSPEGDVIYTNTAWEALTGYSFEDVREKKFTFLYVEKTPSALVREMQDVMKKGKTFMSEELTAERKDGTVYEAAVSLFPVTERGRVIFYTALQQNITRRKEVDKAKTEFVSLASHQLRTPLSAIRWYSEMLLMSGAGELNETQHKYMKEIYDANKRMIELVGALLNVSRIDLGTFGINPEPTSLVELSGSVIKELQHQIDKKQLAVETRYEKDFPQIEVDAQLIRVVFQNLLSNAVKYTPEKGKIAVEIKRQGSNAVFTVTDNGIGIPLAEQGQIFTKLFRADNARQSDTTGTGLGLYIVKAIMEQSGGSIRFESKENAGTIFYGILPLKGSPKRGGDKKISGEYT